MASELNDKVAIVTGSSSGFGEAIALLFASKGANVTLCGRDQDRLTSIYDKVVKISGGNKDRFITIAGDLNDPRIRTEIIERTVNTFGRLDILVVNAAVAGDCNSIFEITEDMFNNIMDTNLKSSFFLIKEAIPHLEKTRGNIVNVSSIATTIVLPLVTTYSLAKAALDQLTRSLAVELGPKGIRVNSVNPGYMQTLILRDYGDPGVIDKKMQELEKGKQPLSGVVGGTEDVAETVAFLASSAARFITGEFIKVDGGRSFSGVMIFPQKGSISNFVNI